MGRGKFIGGKRERERERVRERESERGREEGRERERERERRGHSHSAVVAESGAAVCFADPIMFSRGKMTIPEILRSELRF